MQIFAILLVFALGVCGGAKWFPHNSAIQEPPLLPVKVIHTPSPIEVPKAVHDKAEAQESLTLDNILTASHPSHRIRLLCDWLAQIDSKDSKAVVSLLDHLPFLTHQFEHQLILQFWATEDPAAAANYALNNFDYIEERWGFDIILELWAEQAPEAAKEWLQSIYKKIPERQGAFVADWIRGLARKDFHEAESFVLQPNDGNYSLAYLDALMAAAVEKDSFSISDWNAFVPEFMQAEASRLYVENLVSNNPLAASEKIASFKNQEFSNRLTATVIGALKQNGIETAANWTQTIQNPMTRSNAYTSLIKHWVSEDIQAAGAWLNDHASNNEFDSALRVYAEAASRSNPLTALEWAQSIEDSNQRITSIMAVVRNWQNADKEQALRWLANSDLPDHAKDEFL